MHSQNEEVTPVVESEVAPKNMPTAKNEAKKDHFWRWALVILIIFIPIRLFVAEPFLVYGASMEPNFDTNDYLIVDELTYRLEDPKRGDVIVLRPPYEETRYFIKRIVGLPGEKIVVSNGSTMIYNADHPEGFVLDEQYVKFPSDRNAERKLGPDEYFVMGDNRDVSLDSRNWGPLPKNDIVGRAFLRLYPLNKMSILPAALEDFSKKK